MMNVERRYCPQCPEHTPLVSSVFAARIYARLPANRVAEVISLCAKWAITNVPGLTVFEGITGRDYSQMERAAIELDAHAAHSMSCPFATERGCVLDGMCAPGEWQHDDVAPTFAFLPNALLRLADIGLLRQLVSRHQVADCKIASYKRRDHFPVPALTDRNGAYLAAQERDLLTGRTVDGTPEKRKVGGLSDGSVPTSVYRGA